MSTETEQRPIGKWLCEKKKVWGVLFVILVAFLVYLILPDSCPDAAKRTAFVFIIAAAFWAFEIIPLHATSLLVILVLTFLLTKPQGVLNMDSSGYTVFLDPFSSPVMMLFFGGFVLAEAFRKYKIDCLIASKLLRRFGSNPYSILLGFMVTTAILSMWISNTATTALMLAMISPLLLSMGPKEPFKKALVLAIAFAANIGGTATPIGTPPNAIAIGFLAEAGIHIRFLNWVMMVLPLAIILIFINSLLLYIFFRPQNKDYKFSIESPGSLDRKAKFVLGIGVLTAFLWLTATWHHIPEAVTALVCVGLLTGLGLFNHQDLKHINWDILVLMWGGLALGVGMQISGLAEWVISLPFFANQGFLIIIFFCVITIIFSTFMSNTATVSLMMPLVMSFPGENPVLLATVVALCSSFDFPIPIATPPMAMAYATREIHVKDMLKVGIVFTLIANAFVLFGFKFVMTYFLEGLS